MGVLRNFGILLCKKNMKERWLTIEEYPDYQISDRGKVKSNTNYKRGRLMKTFLDGNGYLRVNLRKNKERYPNNMVHHLVAKAFVENPNGYKILNHKNGIKTDNRAENIEWCTQKQNVHHAVANGLFGARKITLAQANRIRYLYSTGNYSYTDLKNIFGIGTSSIGNIINNKAYLY